MRLRNPWHRAVRRNKWKLITLILAAFLLYQKNMYSTLLSPLCEPIDAVYTWVNGSDPVFIRSIVQFDSNYEKARFDDKNELKYSLRSLEKYAPWIRHVYIVTNGQIPKWLDLTNERVTIVPHEVLTPHLEWLPTFSSSAIETFIHRIPNLSKRFLYLNDDIFLGAHLYPEDLYTDSEGVRIYQAAWLVPDCAEDCPWTYIGDGSCDRHCNIQQCQYDGGDCREDNAGRQMKDDAIMLHNNKRDTATAKTIIGEYLSNGSSITFKDILVKQKQLANRTDTRRIVQIFNKLIQENHQTKKEMVKKDNPTNIVPPMSSTSSMDIYSQSLIYTNMLLNRRYGFKARHVISHVGLLLEKSIIEAMQKEFSLEVLATASHRFRAPNDLQFALLYYTFIMGETYSVKVEDIFKEFDTDRSQTWSDREIRTFLTKIFPLPLDWSAVRFFEDIVQNCSIVHSSETVYNAKHTTILYERYEDSHLPPVTQDLVTNCINLAQAMESNFALRPKYKYQINPKRNVQSNFMMLTSNVTDVVGALDKIRKSPRKFNCINDNLDPKYEDNELIRHLLEDFYLSLFPHRSKYELEPSYRNRFENWRDYLKWRRQQRAFIIIIYGACIILLSYIVRSICIHKGRFVRRCVQKL